MESTHFEYISILLSQTKYISLLSANLTDFVSILFFMESRFHMESHGIPHGSTYKIREKLLIYHLYLEAVDLQGVGKLGFDCSN